MVLLQTEKKIKLNRPQVKRFRRTKRQNMVLQTFKSKFERKLVSHTNYLFLSDFI